jgi:chromosome segregation ATPase
LRRENELLKIHCDNYQNEIEELRERVLEGLRSKISLQQQKKNLEEELENYKLQIISMQERVMHMEQSSQHSINQKK